MSKLIVRSLRMMLFYAMRSDVVEHLAVAGQRPVVLAAQGLGVVGGGTQGVHGGQHVVVERNGLLALGGAT